MTPASRQAPEGNHPCDTVAEDRREKIPGLSTGGSGPPLRRRAACFSFRRLPLIGGCPAGHGRADQPGRDDQPSGIGHRGQHLRDGMIDRPLRGLIIH